MTRLTKLDNDEYKYLCDGDHCYHYGEYTSGGGFKKSETNQQIWNLKSRPTSSDKVLYWKGKAIEYWANKIAESLDLSAVAGNTTFVPVPCSKPSGHPDYDDRMFKVLEKLLRRNSSLDIRNLLVQTQLRDSQHEGLRQSPAQLRKTLAIDPLCLAIPIKPNVVILDDVITLGASYSAAKGLIETIPGVKQVVGIFLAKTVWPPSELDEWLDPL